MFCSSKPHNLSICWGYAACITIPEGCIEDLVHAFRLDYELSEQQNPLDIVIVTGYNDLLKNNSRTFIMEGFRHLSDLVLNLGKNKQPGNKNTFAVASFLYPPCLSWFPDNGEMPLSFKNNLEKINWLMIWMCWTPCLNTPASTPTGWELPPAPPALLRSNLCKNKFFKYIENCPKIGVKPLI